MNHLRDDLVSILPHLRGVDSQATDALEKRLKRNTTKRVHVEVLTHEYEFSHGKLPRGRGGWIFEVVFDLSDPSTSERLAIVAHTAKQGMWRTEDAWLTGVETDARFTRGTWLHINGSYGKCLTLAKRACRAVGAHDSWIDILVMP